MNRATKRIAIFFIVLLLVVGVFFIFRDRATMLLFGRYEIGTVVDSLNGVKVYYNGPVSNVSGRNVAADGYNIGQKYQCVEFVKRYYYEYLKHKMPNSYGHARDFVNLKLSDGTLNKDRALTQYRNPSKSKPKANDLLVMTGGYGHVMIVASVEEDKVNIIQQNPGATEPSRKSFKLLKLDDGKWKIDNSRIAGWLRKE